MASMTAKPEPELTPMVFGLARELFITLCKITPAQESPIPAKSPPSTLGTRTVVIRTYAVEVLSFPVSTSRMSEKVRLTLPNKIPSITAKINSINKKKISEPGCCFIIPPYILVFSCYHSVSKSAILIESREKHRIKFFFINFGNIKEKVLTNNVNNITIYFIVNQ